MERIRLLFSTPIPQPGEWNWEVLSSVPVEDNGEDLVPASLLPEKILVRPEYFIQGLPGAMAECFLRRGVFRRLIEASDLLPQGYRLVLLDGWRPPCLQKQLFSVLEGEIGTSSPGLSDEELRARVCTYVAPPSVDPDRPSPHITGGAIDLSIVDDRGFFLDMGSGFDDTSPVSRTFYYEELYSERGELTGNETTILQNRRFLFNVMKSAGFTNYPDEWWHYDYGNQNWAWASGTSSKAVYGIIYPEQRWRRSFL